MTTFLLTSLVAMLGMLFLFRNSKDAQAIKFEQAREAKRIRLLIEKDKKRNAKSHPLN